MNFWNGEETHEKLFAIRLKVGESFFSALKKESPFLRVLLLQALQTSALAAESLQNFKASSPNAAALPACARPILNASPDRSSIAWTAWTGS
jgi:hypothetical protein